MFYLIDTAHFYVAIPIIQKDNILFNELLEEAKTRTIHIIGLYSDGKVHSNIEHFLSVYELLKENNAINIHFHLESISSIGNSAFMYYH